MIIPNGDLLGAHLINWTMAGSTRQMELQVSIARGTDLQKPFDIIRQLLAANKRIRKNPEPSILIQRFDNYSVDINIMFWVKEFRDGFVSKSEIAAAIDNAFQKNNIPLSSARQEIYINSPGKPAATDGDDETKKP
jgi:small-conductance mechanosensitive channel